MAATNNFKQMAKEDQELVPHAPEQIEQQVMGVVKTGQFAGNVIELYFSKMIEIIMMLFGSRSEKNDHKSNENKGEER